MIARILALSAGLVLIVFTTPLVRAGEFQPIEIKVPEGYEVELAAAPPLVAHPLMACFDERGRLYVAENAGLNLPRKELEQQLPNSVIRLEDVDGDGRFDRRTVFADKMVFPQGALWYRGSLYVASPPSIWKLTDTNDDGVAEKREELVGRFGYTGNAADIHGCFLGPNGRIYWCDGRHGHEIHEQDGELISRGKAARIFSCLPDGSDIRVHCGGGMDNPVEVDFLPNGDVLGTVNLMYLQRGDCLVHWLKGGVYPREDQQPCIEEFAYTGGLLGPVLDYGHVAVSGMTRYRSSILDNDARASIFVTQFNSQKVVRTAIKPVGSTYQAEVMDFLQGMSDDFHPTDVIEDADGSLLVIDTGGWFRIGCPTSQVAKPSVLGAIYRIRHKSFKPLGDPRGARLEWTDVTDLNLIARLDDLRYVVRDRALDLLAMRATANKLTLATLDEVVRDRERRTSLARFGAVWALARSRTAASRPALHSALSDPDSSVQQAALAALGSAGDVASAQVVMELLKADDPHTRRIAATTLSELRTENAVPALIESLTATDVDRSLEHAIIHALLEIGSASPMKASVTHAHPRVQRTAVIVLSQIPDALQREHVQAALRTDDANLQAEVVRVIEHKPEWAQEIVKVVRDLVFRGEELNDEQTRLLQGALLALRESEELRQSVSEALNRKELQVGVHALLLESIAEMRLESWPSAWIDAVTTSLGSHNPRLLDAAIQAAAVMRTEPLVAPLQRIARDERQESPLRLRAFEAWANQDTKLSAPEFAFLMSELKAAPDVLLRLAAARILATVHLSVPQMHQLAMHVKDASPLEVTALTRILERIEEPKPFMELLAAFAANEHAASLDFQQLLVASERFGDPIQQDVRRLAEKHAISDTETAAKIAKLLEASSTGDATRGEHVFFSSQIGCAACHRINHRGGYIGPDLSQIGARRSPRDLLEAILAPSASQARGFETFVVTTTDGRITTGRIESEAANFILLRAVDQSRHKILRDQIESISPSSVSLMPLGLDRTMTSQQLSDLVAYLHSLK